MSQVDFLNLFVRSPGELLYFCAVIAISLSAFFMALGHSLRYPEDHATRRYAWALGGVVIAWFMLLGGALLVLLTDSTSITVLPPLEQFAIVVTLLCLVWAFITVPGWGQIPAVITALGLTLATIAYAYTASQWSGLAGTVDFNLSVLGATWTFFAAGLAGVGLILVLGNFGQVLDAPLKLVFFLVLLAGYIGTLLQIVQGDIVGNYAGAVRLSFVIALVIVPALIYRSIVAYLETTIANTTRQTAATPPVTKPNVQRPVPRGDVPVVSPIERESVQLLRALGVILEEATATSVPQQIVRAAIEVLKSDVAALLRLQDANYADVVYAHDGIMKREIDGLAINLDNQPTLVNSIERQQQRILRIEENAEELRDLYTRLDIEQNGPVYFQPLLRDKELVGVLVLMLPYTRRELLRQEEELLKGIAVIAGSLLSLSYAATDAQLLAEERTIQALVQGVSPSEIDDEGVVAARYELQSSLQLAREQIAQLSRQVMQLKLELDDERSKISTMLEGTDEGMAISQQMIAINDTQRLLIDERDQLAEQLTEAETALRGALSDNDETLMREMIDRLQQEKTDLMNQQERLQRQLDELRASDRVVAPDDMQDVVDRMMREQAELQQERDQLKARLSSAQEQLESLGIETGKSGLSQLVRQLTDQRLDLQSENVTLKQERNQLIEERDEVLRRLEKVKDHEQQLQSLETHLGHLAGERESAVKQLDKLRTERDELQNKLDLIKEHRTRLMAQSTSYQMELEEAHQEQKALREQLQALSNERDELTQQRDWLKAAQLAAETERDQLLARMEGDRGRVEVLGNEGVGSLTGMIEDLTAQRTDLNRRVNELESQIAARDNQLEALHMRLKDSANGARYRPNNPDLLISLVEEFRTPMTSIIGYVDLLSSESAGILGELQRQFLRRVATNVNRLSYMMDDLVKVTELDTGRFTLERGPINIIDLLDEAITDSSEQFREKGLVLNLNMDANLPSVIGDEDAINQIIGQLLTNAYLVSPPNSEIFITANRADDDYVQIAIEDRGGGISPEDEARIFARKYKAENPLIQGLGDTGVGLSVAKALVEAHDGQIWLESIESVGSKFTFTLPISEGTQHAS